jgi:hypothetical protein
MLVLLPAAIQLLTQHHFGLQERQHRKKAANSGEAVSKPKHAAGTLNATAEYLACVTSESKQQLELHVHGHLYSAARTRPPSNHLQHRTFTLACW